ncbi:hypothetical protein VA596_41580 [Amycolatopsis sp., V23-08]|uniref:Zinc ribbon domain-containing protein n=1 Tax=Amycolatopsis heterodermiae TaxID=3110235 RepID=A0ABU5RIS8_9PSEU|nr:hypothetical protein [Amycolatopsis sp., V23-08]MEA5366078.1 hypothetical protein [Amycolatopsis sp., V23-08]
MSGQPGPVNGNRFRLLQLLPDYLAHPEGFARPAPPAAPPLPLKFTCRACGEQVHPDATRCSRCLAKLYER